MRPTRKDNDRVQAVGVGKQNHIRQPNYSAELSNEPVAVKAKIIQFPSSRVKHAPSIIAQHFCTCRAGAVCLFCLSWNRTILGIEARSQALGQRARAGG